LERNIALDILKITLAFMVVGIHSGFLSEVSSLAKYLTVNGLFRIAVPIYFIINGYFFHSIVVNNNIYPWIKRVFFLYLFWMFFYSYLWFTPVSFSLVETIKLIKTLIFGYYHLWYIAGIFGAAILLLFLRKLSSSLIFLIIIITFIIGVSIQYVGNYHFSENPRLDKLFNTLWVYRNFLFFGFPFFALGYLFKSTNIHERISLKLSLLLSVIGFFTLILESYVNYIQETRDGGFDSFISLLLVCPSIFLVFIKLQIKGQSKNIALYSSGIYFIHLLFLDIFIRHTNLIGTSLTFSVFSISIIASYLIIRLHKKLKFIL